MNRNDLMTDLGQAIADMEWTMARARAALQEVERIYPLIPWWRHPVLKVRLWYSRRDLRRVVV